ncbi:hypothetical protein JHK86_041238 [Glycine max]|nr:hypothetical protein JHK86_041238 [Glycine max]
MVICLKLIIMWNVALLLVFSLIGSAKASVSYDSKAITINGQRRILISGSIHYPRSTPEMWPDLIQKAKDGGLDVIQTYVFWNGHEPSPGKYYFEGNYDLVKFIKLVQQAGLYVHLRIGPYVCAEWNFGGFPVWLKYIPGISFRTDNEPFKVRFQSSLYLKNWFTEFGGPVPHRPAEDLAFSVARFIQKGGSFINYYMYHGGTNFGRTAGGPFIATSYDYDAPLDEYGLLRQPKWGHLKDLHRAIKLCEPALVSGDPTVTKIGNYQEAHVFKSKSGACAAFLANYNPKSYATVAFGNMHYNLPPWSISILPDCKNTVYNTARVGSQSAQMKMTRVPIHGGFSWLSFNEETTTTDDSSFTMTGLLEQLNTTRDLSDYLWYSTDVVLDPNEGFLRNGKDPVLTVFSAGHALHVFINGQLSGTAYGSLEFPKLTFNEGVKLRAGVNKISLLSVANVGPHFETWNAGVLGPISLSGLNEGRRDLSWQKWSYKVGLKGEILSLHSLSGSSSVEWIQGSLVSQRQPLTWYKTTFDAPAGTAPLALDMDSMGKGQVWLNGQNLGRYWPAYKASGTCDYCDYAGTYNENKCRSNCGEASQRWYHVPQSWLKPTGNLLVVFEELGGDPNGIFLVRRDIDSVCADIYEWQPNLISYQMQTSGKAPVRPKVHLSCSPGQKISSIKFASFGTPAGSCGNFHEGSCHAHKSYDAFERNCVGQNWCTVTVSPENFGGDPCPNVLKKLSVEAICS